MTIMNPQQIKKAFKAHDKALAGYLFDALNNTEPYEHKQDEGYRMTTIGKKSNWLLKTSIVIVGVLIVILSYIAVTLNFQAIKGTFIKEEPITKTIEADISIIGDLRKSVTEEFYTLPINITQGNYSKNLIVKVNY